jgi:hypothetical protein
MSDREKALEAARKLADCVEKWADHDGEHEYHAAVLPVLNALADFRAALAMPATVDRADFLRGWEAGRDAAAAECERLRESYRRARNLQRLLSVSHRIVKYSGAAVAVCAENIRNLTPPEDAP